MIDYKRIIEYYYPEADQLRGILISHSERVAAKALAILEAHPELHADADVVYAGAMLHDIGIIRCDADGIACTGTQPYISHGIVGATMLRMDAHRLGYTNEEIEPFARICERHTGTGLTVEQIVREKLPVPCRDLSPQTIEEQIICYADKFFSKTHPEVEKPYDRVEKSLLKFGTECIAKLQEWHKCFE